MILGFKEFFDAKKTQPTYFREKILAGVHPNLAAVGSEKYPITYPRTILLNSKPKIHTFREDLYNRWKVGMSIQMVYRGPKYSIKSHFNKGIPELQMCKGIQFVEVVITYKATTYKSDNTKEYSYSGKVRIDGIKVLTPEECRQLAINDGFESVGDFFNYFRKGFDGKILHFSDFRY